VAFTHFAYAQDKAIPLYEKTIPNSKEAPANYAEHTDSSGLISNVTTPGITPYFPQKGKSSGTAVIIFPGGGYSVLSSEDETAIAREFNKIGITAFVLKYRLPNDTIMIDKTIGPLQDAQTAVQIVRKRAAEWGINPNKIGLVGLSAGGHLASTEGTHYDNPVIENKEHISLRPDFMVLIYPVIIFDPLIPSGTRETLIGKTPSTALLNLYSNEKHVTTNTPPTFLVHAADDDVVPVKNSLRFFNALLSYQVKAEMHILQSGGHGFGLENPKSKDKWFDWCKNWLNENGF
jgi:acetyl esterase/lipase